MNKKKSSWFAKKNSLDKSCRKSQNTEAKEYAALHFICQYAGRKLLLFKIS